MIGYLGGNADTVAAYQSSVGKTIATVALHPDEGDGVCRITFRDGSVLTIRDDGRSCCESRYMVCDDDLSTFAGAELRGIDSREGPNEPDSYGEPHETAFVDVKTSNGDFTLCTHNEHNGYYGGFWIVLNYEEPKP